jgi:hypothetical protein
MVSYSMNHCKEEDFIRYYFSKLRLFLKKNNAIWTMTRASLGSCHGAIGQSGSR